MEEERLVKSTIEYQEIETENILRPKSMDGYIGQETIKDNLAVAMTAAKLRGDTLDHILLYGPPGLGKTTLAHIIANEMGTQIKVVSGPAIERSADLLAILTKLEEGDVLFIDEIHRLRHTIEEVLYPAMEDFNIDYINGKGPMATSIQIALKKFTLIGATTKAGMLSSPLRDRFGVIFRLENYSATELTEIVCRASNMLGVKISPDAAKEIAMRSRGTPRIANRLLRRVRDFATYKGHETILIEDAKGALKMLGIDEFGLDAIDVRLLTAMAERFNGKPCGLDTLAATINEDANTIEDVYEPYLLQLGFIARSPRGRILLKKGYEHINYPLPKEYVDQINLD